MPGPVSVVEGDVAARGRLREFRAGFYGCLRRRADALFELADAVLTVPDRVESLVRLAEEAAFRRGHDALYAALSSGVVAVGALGRLLADSWEPADAGPVKVAVDVSPWPRPHAETSPERANCYRSCRCRGSGKTVPGWPYSFAAGLEWGANSWTALLDAARLTPDDDATLVTVAQIARVTWALQAAGRLSGRPAALFVFDAGYDLTRISHLAHQQGLGVQVLGRIKANRVYHATPVQRPRHLGGRPRRHGAEFKLADPATWPDPDATTTATSPRYGTVTVRAWHHKHQQLDRYRGWKDFQGELPIVPGTLIQITVEHLPGNRAPKPIWLWHTAPDDTDFDLDLLWRAYLRRFDLEHTFRLLKQALGWTRPQIRTPAQGDRWTWLILAVHAQLRLARHLVHDLRRPWEKPPATDRPLTPGRVRRGFPHLRRHLGTPTRKPKPSHPGPGSPQGITRPPRTRHPVGKQHQPHQKRS